MSEASGTIGPYTVLQTLGAGGMGVVYRAKHIETDQAVALKTVRVVDQGNLQSMRREIHALSRLRHPGIVRILNHGVQEGLPWYAMELLDGVPLREWCFGAELASGRTARAAGAPGPGPCSPPGAAPSRG